MSLLGRSTNKCQCPYRGCDRLLGGVNLEEHLATHRSEVDYELRLHLKQPKKELTFCPYNVCHIVPMVELETHKATCPSRQRYLMIQSLLASDQLAASDRRNRPSPLPTSFSPRTVSTETTEDGRCSSDDSGRGESVSTTPRSLQSLTPVFMDINDDDSTVSIESFVSEKMSSQSTMQKLGSDCGPSPSTAEGNAKDASLGGSSNRFVRPRNGPMARKKKVPV